MLASSLVMPAQAVSVRPDAPVWSWPFLSGGDLKVSFKVGSKVMADGVIEIITGRERRRRWSLEDKLRIVAETLEPGGSVQQVAARHDLYPGLLFTWRRQVRSGKLARPQRPMFLPVQTHETGAPVEPMSSERSGVASRQIEVELPGGSRVRGEEGVSLTALRHVLAALRG